MEIKINQRESVNPFPLPEYMPRKQRVYKGVNSYRVIDFCGNCKAYSMMQRFCMICGGES